MTTQWSEASRTESPNATAILTALMAVAVVVSVVHYADNYLNYEQFPQSPTAPDPSAGLVLAAWFIFTGAGLVGYLLFRRAPSAAAILLLAFYAGSGLVGLGHYTVEGALEMPWWRHAHIVADIACGVAVLTFCIWAWRGRAARHGAEGAFSST